MELSEEEKKAIDYLKNDIESYVYLLNSDDKRKDYYIREYPNMEAKRILLNLVEKQQKEIEELKTNLEKFEVSFALSVKDRDSKAETLKNSISKDKIREKLKEIENRRIEEGKCELAIYGFQRDAKIEVLQELLEENIMSDEEIAIETLKEVASDDFDTLGDDISPKMAQNILSVINKQQKENEEYKKFKKDIVNKIMIWDKEELPDNDAIISMLDTFKAEVSRLEDIEDKKVMVAIDLIEEKKDKFWKDKIKNKIEQLKEIADEDNPDIYIKIDAYEELLEEK